MSILKDILGEIEARGLNLYLDDGGRPRLGGPPEMKTSALLDVLRLHRRRIIAHLGGDPDAAPPTPSAQADSPPAPEPAPSATLRPSEAMAGWRAGAEGREWLHRDGTVMDGAGDWPPQAVYWFRYRLAGGGQTPPDPPFGPWQPIDGRTPMCMLTPLGVHYGCAKPCGGCVAAGGPWEGVDRSGPWTPVPYFAALAEERKRKEAARGVVG